MFTKLIRIGRDSELKTLPTGTQVLEFSAVYDVGFGDKKKPVWVKVAMFGQKAPNLVQHFTKGKQIVATMDGIEPQAWIKDGEAKSGLKATLVSFEFAGGPAQTQPAQQQQQYQPAPQQRAPQQAPSYGTPPPNHAPQQQPVQGYPQQANQDMNEPPF